MIRYPCIAYECASVLHYTKLEWLSIDKESRLIGPFMNYLIQNPGAPFTMF
jgi:hypothetical protein